MFRLRFARDTLNGVAAKEAGDYVCAQSGRRALRRRLKGGLCHEHQEDHDDINVRRRPVRIAAGHDRAYAGARRRHDAAIAGLMPDIA